MSAPSTQFPWLSEAEIAELCHPLEQPAAQIRYLQREGYHVRRRPDGRPLLMRSELERVAGAGRLATGAAPSAGAGSSTVGGPVWSRRIP